MKEVVKLFCPVVGYLFLSAVLTAAAGMVFGETPENYNFRAAVAGMICLPVVVLCYRRSTMPKAGWFQERSAVPKAGWFQERSAVPKAGWFQERSAVPKAGWFQERSAVPKAGWFQRRSAVPGGRGAVFFLVFTVAASVVANNLILASGVAERSAAYQEISGSFYAGDRFWLYLGSGVLAPVLEELVYRGMVYARCRRMICGNSQKCEITSADTGTTDRGTGWSRLFCAMVFSSLLFGIVHGNLPQMIYAFVVGFLLCACFEIGGILLAVFGHMGANLSAIIRSTWGFYVEMEETPHFFFLETWTAAVVAAAAFFFFLLRTRVSKN